MTLSESYCQTIWTYLEFISNSIHTFTELLPSNSKYFFENLNGHLNRQNTHTHTKQIILASTIFEFTWLVIDGFMEENRLGPCPSKDISSHQSKKKIFRFLVGGMGWLYTMENKDTKADYQEVVRVGNQKWGIVETAIRIIFLVWDSYSLFFISRKFSSPTWKNSSPPKVSIPNQNSNLT